MERGHFPLCEVVEEDRSEYCNLSPVRCIGEGKDVSP